MAHAIRLAEIKGWRRCVFGVGLLDMFDPCVERAPGRAAHVLARERSSVILM